MPASIEDVARAANVSTATVSRALRGLPNVSQHTRAKVQHAATQLNYAPSRNASALASGRCRSIGIVTPAIARWFFSSAIEGAADVLRDAGYDALLYCIPDQTTPRTRFDPDVLRQRVDAMIVASLSLSAREMDAVRSLDIPAVFISLAQPGFGHVGIDDTLAAHQATQHLIDLGHRHIAHLGGRRSDTAPTAPTHRRRAGWRATLLAAGLEAPEAYDFAGDFSAQAGYRATTTILADLPEVTALFAASDEMAMGAIQALHDARREPGRDLSVIGIDGHLLDDVIGLTSVEQPVRAQGGQAARMVLDTLDDNPSPDVVLFPTTLVRRASTAPPRA
ncbi:MAG: LacI family transcriptional regulator [Actinomycetia bacterium]|nr:LacI family transcriptional regulator [Actinomycetes bacterium]